MIPFLKATVCAIASVSFIFSLRDINMLNSFSRGARSNDVLIMELKTAGIIKSPEVADAMMNVDRKDYVSSGDPYYDSPQGIGHGQTISAPHMHAYALEYLLPAVMRPGAKVLDVGCGSGYFTAILAHANPSVTVYGIDYIPELVRLSEENIRKHDSNLIDSKRIILDTRDGWNGWSEYAPFDAIHVGAAAETTPKQLLAQLKVGGIMIIPVGTGIQELQMYEKRKASGSGPDSIHKTHLMGVRYVPLVKTDGAKDF